MRTVVASIALVLTVAACIPTPIPPPAPRTGTSVSSSFDRAWNGVIDVFTARNIPIRNIEKASGLVVTEPLLVNDRSATQWADCGNSMGIPLLPTNATYNVLVRGDSARANVRVTVRWMRAGAARGFSTAQVVEECSTRGVWENSFESEVKRIAEGQ